MSKRYVPENTTLVCSEGMSVQMLKVSSQSSIRIAGGKLAATIDDRTGGNFMCAKMITAGAMIGALIAAAICVAIVASGGAVAVGVGAAMAAGAAGGAGLGALTAMIPCICALLTKPAPWTPFHPTVTFEGKKALIESSRVSCLLGGQVMIFYSPEAAQEAVDLKRKETAIKVTTTIALAYIMGPAIEAIGATACTAKGIFATFGSAAGWNYVAGFGVSFGFSYGAGLGLEKAKLLAYEAIPVGDKKVAHYVYGFETDIVKLNDSGIPEVKEVPEEPDKTVELHVKDAGGALGTSRNTYEHSATDPLKNNRINSYTIESLDSETTIMDKRGKIIAQEVSQQNTSTFQEGEGKITSKNTTPTDAPLLERSFEVDKAGNTYTNNTRYSIDEGLQYKPFQPTGSELKNSGTSLAKSFGNDQFGKPSAGKGGVNGGGFYIDLMMDLWTGITNALLAEDAKEFVEAVRTHEAKAKAGINVIAKKV